MKIMKNLNAPERGVVSVAYAMAIILILFVVSAALLTSIGTNTRGATIDLLSTQAYYVAEAGAEWTLKMLGDSSNWRTGVTNMPVGFGTVTITIDDSTTVPALVDTIRITSVSTLDNIQKTLVVYAKVTGGDIWPYAAYGGNDVKFKSGTVTGDVHANNGVSLGSTTVTGTVTSGSSVDPPNIDWNYYKSLAIASGKYRSSSKTFDETTITGVWYIKGTATLDEEVSINGTLVAENDIKIEDEDYGTFQTASPNFPVLISGNSITYKPDDCTPQIKGIVYAENDFKAEKKLKLQGAIISGSNTVDCDKKSVNLTYDANYTTNIQGMSFGGGGGGGSSVEVFKWQEN